MTTGIAQKSYKALFPLWSLKKKRYTEINKLNSCRGKIEGIGENIDIETKKKVKTILILFYMNCKKFAKLFSYQLRCNL